MKSPTFTNTLTEITVFCLNYESAELFVSDQISVKYYFCKNE